MFEKEAKEYTHTKHCEKCFAGHCEKKCFLVKDDFETFKDGAELGYNKAKEEAMTKLDSKIRKLQEAKTVIQDLLSNSDEYARQMATDWLNESE